MNDRAYVKGNDTSFDKEKIRNGEVAETEWYIKKKIRHDDHTEYVLSRDSDDDMSGRMYVGEKDADEKIRDILNTANNPNKPRYN